MEKRRSSRKPEPLATPEKPAVFSFEAEPTRYPDLFSKKNSKVTPVEVEEFLIAAERVARRMVSEILSATDTGPGSSADDIKKIGLALETIRAADDRAAKVFIARVIEGRSDGETARALQISKPEVRNAWRNAKKLIAGNLKKKEGLPSHISKAEDLDKKSKLPSIIARATEVIGDREKAMRWLGTPVRGLDYATPISLLATEEGAERVNDILGQIEHGVW